jgi:hypothetical protein
MTNGGPTDNPKRVGLPVRVTGTPTDNSANVSKQTEMKRDNPMADSRTTDGQARLVR